MSDIEILDQIKTLAGQLANARDRRYVSEAIQDISSGVLDKWDMEEMEKDLHECECLPNVAQ